MGLRVAASSDARALAIRDHILPLIRQHGTIEDLENKDSVLRLIVLRRDAWRFTHWTPFNALNPSQASSPAYRHALAQQRTRADLPYGLDISHDDTELLSLLWAESGMFVVVRFVRGTWEEAVLALQM